MPSPDINGAILKRVSTADGAARPRMHSLHDDADKMNKTVGGLSINEVVKSKMAKSHVFGIDGYYLPVRETSRVKPW